MLPPFSNVDEPYLKFDVQGPVKSLFYALVVCADCIDIYLKDSLHAAFKRSSGRDSKCLQWTMSDH